MVRKYFKEYSIPANRIMIENGLAYWYKRSVDSSEVFFVKNSIAGLTPYSRSL